MNTEQMEVSAGDEEDGEPENNQPEPNNPENVRDHADSLAEHTEDEYQNDGDETESNPDPASPPSYDL